MVYIHIAFFICHSVSAKKRPGFLFRKPGRSYTLLVLSQALTPLLAGVLDRSLSGCQNCRAFKSIYLHLLCLLERLSIVNMVMAVILHPNFNIFRKCRS